MIKIKNDLDTDDNVMVDIDTDNGDAIDDIKDEDDNEKMFFKNIFFVPSECFLSQFKLTFKLFLREFYSLHY